MARFMEGTISAERLNTHLLLTNGSDTRITTPLASHAETRPSSPMAEGRLSFIALSDDLQLHVCRYTEQQQASSHSLLPASINVTVLLKGCVEFRVGNKFYCFDATHAPVAFANIIAMPEPFTRYMQHNQTIEKVTVSVAQSWVNTRLGVLGEQLLASSKVLELPLDTASIEQTIALLATPTQPTLIDKLNSEGHAVLWLSTLLASLLAGNLPTQANYRLPPSSDTEVKKAELMTLLEQGLAVEDIARQLAMSVSSLQRFFKRHFNTSPKQYLKQHTLFKARHALLVEGLSIGEAAYLAHYDHVGNFIAAFKKQFGVTPMQFVKQHRR